MTKPKKRSAKPLATVFEPQGNEADAAEMFGSVLALRLFVAAGVLPVDLVPPDCRFHGECAKTLEEAGVALGVSGRWVQTLKARGLPTLPDGRIPIAAAKFWRSQLPEPPAENPAFPRTNASGDLVRAILRHIRIDLPIAIGQAWKEFQQTLATIDRDDGTAVHAAFDDAMAKHLVGFCHTDEGIEKLLEQCWGLV